MPGGRHANPVKKPSTIKARFLAIVSQGGSVTAACRAAGVHRRTPYTWRAEDPDFAREWEDAYESGTDRFEDALRALAAQGDITAIIFALKGRRAEVYNRRWLEPEETVPLLPASEVVRRRIFIPAMDRLPEAAEAAPEEVPVAEPLPRRGVNIPPLDEELDDAEPLTIEGEAQETDEEAA